jgi:hypothetical protein
VVLLACELATNAIIHTGQAFEVTVDLTATCLQIAVNDPNSILPTPGHPDNHDIHGRGLPMVDALADRWGIEPTATGKRAWFELCHGPTCTDHTTRSRLTDYL